MAGMPGSGKDTWIGDHASRIPVVSLDAIRGEIGAPPVGNQGEVLRIATERTREMLRAGTGFVWNATNLPRETRTPLIGLFTGYGARVRVVYVESPRDRQRRQNRDRGNAVPEDAVDRMLERWEIPDPTEAPIVEWWENSGAWRRVL
jgi:predicted kinase